MSPTSSYATKIALVVDDALSVRHYHSVILKRAGFHCEAAATSDEALQKTDHVAVNLAIVDIQMPGLNGSELIGLIRKKPGLARLPILVIANKTAAKDFAAVPGPIGFTTKPLSPDAVITEIRRLVRESGF